MFPILLPKHSGRLNAIALNHYIEFYDFTGLKLDHAFRYDFFTERSKHFIPYMLGILDGSVQNYTLKERLSK